MTDAEITEMLEKAGIDPVKLTCCRCQTTPEQARVLSLMKLHAREGARLNVWYAGGRWNSEAK